MTRLWPDLVARARGLSTHLLSSTALERLRRLQDIRLLTAELERHGFAPAGRGPGALDLAVRRWAATHLALLARWAGTRAGILAVLFEEEDRRAIRAILRGVVARQPPEAMLAGLVPTVQLPERALATLAEQRDVRRVAALLTAWGHPLGPPLVGPASATTPDLFRLEGALARAYATRALRLARRGGHSLVGYVRTVIDLENAWSALALSHTPGADLPEGGFLQGGALLPEASWRQAARAPDAEAAGRELWQAFRSSSLARAFDGEAVSRDRVESDVLPTLILLYVRIAREAPLGAAPIVLFALRLRAEVEDLRRIIWSAALGVPGAVGTAAVAR
jgi:vacuolar-type H+-ATPase subunit C/Vma6